MQKLQDQTILKEVDHNQLKQSFVKAMAVPLFRQFVESLGIKEELLEKYTSRLLDAYQEAQHCKNCPGLGMCQNEVVGFVMTPEQEENVIHFSYRMCPFQKKLEEEHAYQKNIYQFDIPKKVRDASLKEVYVTDKNRTAVIRYFKDFIKHYKDIEKPKGLYLYGSFGTGKSYLLAALFNELAKKKVRSAMIYYPEFLRSLKESFGTDYKEKFETIKKAPLLLLDDIGAENMTAWSRDEVLGPLLQYRMDEGLPTFFTSNFNYQELEEHFASGSSMTEKVKARRILERMKQLTIEMTLIGDNYRK